jgi:hypothetical protein
MALIEVDWKPPRRQLRQFAVLFLVVFGAIGTLAWLDGKPQPLVWTLWGASAAVGIAGLLFPPAVRPVYVAMMAVALPIGLVVSTVLMVIIYFLVLTPLGLLLRLFGHDPMGRRPAPDSRTFWVERPRDVAVNRYFKQY